MLIRCQIDKDGSPQFSSEDLRKLRAYSGRPLIFEISEADSSELQTIAGVQALDLEVVARGLEQEGAWS